MASVAGTASGPDEDADAIASAQLRTLARKCLPAFALGWLVGVKGLDLFTFL